MGTPSDPSDRIGRLLQAALERPASDRQAFLASACAGDDALRHEVASLLCAHEQAGPFLATAACEAPLEASDGAARPRLPSGMRLGPYELVGLIGAGGMGEVYRARDTRLDREVALKVLNRELAPRPRERARFEREARAVSRLAHPHICSLYDVGSASSDEGEVPFLVMELVDGETLAARLGRGPMPVPEAIAVARQIAEALAAAHEHGIVHRDLKPANIMLARTGADRAPGHVRLLDFGLARLHSRESGAEAQFQPAGTLTTGAVLLGTVPYMAPEQIRGEPTDARTDLFAFGAVFYEMLTGHRAFAGSSQAALAMAIVQRTPPPPSTVQPGIPEVLDRFVEACLAKAPADRWQHAHDVVLQLRALETPGALEARRTTRPRFAGGRWRSRPGALTVSAGMGLALGVGLLLMALRATPPVPPASVRQLDLAVPRLASLEGLAFSPNGEHLAFIAQAADTTAVWIRSLGEPVARVVPGTQGAHRESPPFWSPDGEWIVFVAGGSLRRIHSTGGEAQVIADAPAHRGGIWGPDGTMLVGGASGTHGVHRVDLAGGRLVPLVPLEPHAFLQALPKFLPDGRRFLYLTWTADRRHRDICIASLDRPSGRCLGVQPDFFVGIAEPGHVLFTRGGTLFAQPFDGRTGGLTDAPRVLVDGIAHDPFGRAAVSVAPTGGALVYQLAVDDVRELVWVDRHGTPVDRIGDATPQGRVAISANGAAVAVERPSRTGTTIWTIDDRGAARPAAGAADASAPFLSPDGLTLSYLTRLSSGHAAIVERPARGGPERVLYEYRGDGVLYFADRSADGTLLVVGIADRDGRFAHTLPVSGGTPERVVGGPGVGLGNTRISPDLQWLAYESRQTGRAEIYVSPIPPTGEERRVSVSGGQHPYWSADGRELLFVDPDGWLMSAPVTTGAPLAFGVPQRLFKTDLQERALGWSRRFAVTADGQRFLLSSSSSGRTDAETSTLRVVLNWPQLGSAQVRARQATPSSPR